MSNPIRVYPIGLKLKTTKNTYIIEDYHKIGKYFYGYYVRNLDTNKAYKVSYSRIHSSSFKFVSPTAKVLFGDISET